MKISARDPEGRFYRAFLNGVDISNDCFEADDQEGYVLVYKTDENGRKVRRNGWGEPEEERLEGKVVLKDTRLEEVKPDGI